MRNNQSRWEAVYGASGQGVVGVFEDIIVLICVGQDDEASWRKTRSPKVNGNPVCRTVSRWAFSGCQLCEGGQEEGNEGRVNL
ncbi:hypothetical protein [Deinococcus hopiensis]|uniref:Uncharacterized protein n=1 Tax=Deinococcus hopiensis KR-140 TaxID=695939 RepID=A0A1W1UBM1_9DEIO|nr:hypothetical protein [Deinococcus hopiensis]SMB78459.1 hypothetical protein SAMN00790413_06667 [Deinococcus hopiensis KR-140]